MSDFDAHVAAATIRCPRCGARPEKPCREPVGRRKTLTEVERPHLERAVRAKQEAS